ncbi:MAG: rod shape-determining protein MreC [Eggerthellaceae bacterium]|nr:rod shape-determining protein MreC [Eggerthellaceae bacterium]
MPFNMQQNGAPGARNIVLVALLIVSLVLVTVYAREGATGPIHSFQNLFTGGSAVVGSAGARVGSATESAGNSVTDLTANESSLVALREQNQKLRQMLSDAEEYRQEVERLQGLLDMKQVSGVTGPVAHIIGRSANAWDQSITIDLGSNDGVEAGMTIMGASGVIGQVSQTAEKTSTVRLLTDPNSGAAVMIQSSRANGIVRGSINGLLYLEDLDEGVVPEVGDVIITSGLGGSYERGLIVGAVVNVNMATSTTAGTVIVSPNDSAAMLEEVIVVFKAPDVAAAEAAAARAAEEAQQSSYEEDEYDDDWEGEEY